MGHQLAQRLKFIKSKIKVWRKEIFGNLTEKKNQLLFDIHCIDEKEEMGGLSEDDLDCRSILKEQCQRVIFQEELKWKQRSRNKWLYAGDHNTKFLHAIASARCRINQINTISAGGRLWERREDIYIYIEREREKLFIFSVNFIQVSAGLGPRWMGFQLEGIPKRGHLH